MSDTIIALLKNIIKENRVRSIEEIYKCNKLKLLKPDIIKQFKKGIPSELYLSYLTYYLDDKILFEMDDYDYIVINVGTNILKSMINKLVYFNDHHIYGIDDIKSEYLDLVVSIYDNNDIITCFEYSDNEGRIILVNKYRKYNDRSPMKICKDFAFYNLLIDDKEDIK